MRAVRTFDSNAVKCEFWNGRWNDGGTRTAWGTYIAGEVAGKTILELGCGDAPGPSPEKTAEYVGVDFSKIALKKAKRNSSVPKSNFVCADAVHLPFQEDVFDKAIATETMTLMGGSLPDVLKELRRVIKTGGETHFNVTHTDLAEGAFGPNALITRAYYGSLFDNKNRVIACMSEDNVKPLLGSAGLTLKSSRALSIEELYRVAVVARGEFDEQDAKCIEVENGNLPLRLLIEAIK